MIIDKLGAGHCVCPSVSFTLASTLTAFAQPSLHTDKRYVLFSVEPGMGKTGALGDYTRQQKALGYPQWTGLIIAMATREEIRSFLDRAMLDASDYTVVVQKSHDLSDRGRPDHDNAPIILTTHSMLRRLCKGKMFGQVEQYHYHGLPRQMRVWDEAFVPAEPSVVRKDSLMAPLERFRPVAPKEAQYLTEFTESLQAPMAGQIVNVPLEVLDACRHAKLLDDGALGTLGNLTEHSAVLVNDGGHGLALIGAHSKLPPDFAPAIIMDASGRLKKTYNIMEDAGHLRRLRTIEPNYEKLTVHHFQRKVSRTSFVDAEKRGEILNLAAETINETSQDEPWLVIHFMKRETEGHDIIEELKSLVPHHKRLSFIHWGNHHGTNDYRHIKNVMVLGVLRYPQSAYRGLMIAAGRSMNTEFSAAEIKAAKRGEVQHNLLQGICRANARNWEGGECGECTVYLMGDLSDCGAHVLEETFPSASIIPWYPLGLAAQEKHEQVVEAVREKFSDPLVTKLSKQELGLILGYAKNSGGLAKHLRKQYFKQWLQQEGLKLTARAIIRI